ncbi:RNA-binding S4 domain-containing protein [Hoeflea sp. WL0058]|uniref:RNA-binding S4 domain-containing protein n=1 Tax=Flavimaribacter sediminis TaxID=2865987 RepID=A0AAE2ZTJ3_9HYPH|nr:RNA-binding S4 domain-containing protein [Flavimaribacter sediminis]
MRASQRIDKWLFYARVLKSRSLAAKLVQKGRVRVNGDKIDRASRMIVAGDVLTITLDRVIKVLEVVDPGTRRGPYEEARQLYRDISPEPSPKEYKAPGAMVPLREAGSGRPTKRDRRQIDRWKALTDE